MGVTDCMGSKGSQRYFDAYYYAGWFLGPGVKAHRCPIGT